MVLSPGQKVKGFEAVMVGISGTIVSINIAVAKIFLWDIKNPAIRQEKNKIRTIIFLRA